MNSLSISFLSTGVINLGLSFLVYLKKRLSNKIFAIFSLELALWCFVDSIVAATSNLSLAEFFVRIAFAIGALLPPTFFLFVNVLGEEKIPPEGKRKIYIFYLISFVTILVCFFPSFIQKSYWPSSVERIIVMPGPEVEYGKREFGFYIISVLFMMTYGLIFLYRKKRKKKGILLLEIQYVFIGVLSGTVFTTFTSLFPSLFGTSIPARFAPFSSAIMSGIIAYAIAKHKIMDITLVYEKVVLHLLVGILLFLIYFIVVFLFQRILSFFEFFSVSFSYFIGAFCVGILYHPLKEKLQNFLRIKFLRQDLTLFSQRVFDILFSLDSMDSIFLRLQEVFKEFLNIPPEILLLLKENIEVDIHGEKFLAHIAIYPAKESFILKSLEKSRILIKEEEERFKNPEKEKIIKEFNQLGYEVAVGIIQRGSLIGAILLKKKIDGTVFTFKEQILLENLGAQLGIAIENLKLYHQISEINSYIRSLLDNSPFGVISFDKFGRITIFNKQMEKLMSKREEEVRGKHFSEVLPSSVSSIVKKIFHKKVPVREEIFLNREGKKYIIQLNIVPFWDEEKRFIGVQMIFADITKIKQLEEEIRRADKLASIGVMAAGIAHEIKNPLVSIKAFAQLLPERYQDEEFRHSFSELTAREVDRINSLIEQVLEFSKLKIPRFEKVDVVKVMKSALVLFSTQSKKKNLNILENYYSARIIIEGNEEKLQQAFLNILINAGEAIEEGGIIKINVLDEVENVRIEIEDNGCGIKREILDKIFDPFFTTKEKGTGLGLSIVSKIIEEHKGKLRVESEEKIGTKVIIILRKKMKEITNELYYSNK